MPKRLTTEQFIEKARAVHGDKYGYSKVVYVRNTDKIEIVCKEHGSFWQRPNNHLSGWGCIKCGARKQGTGKLLTLDETIKAFKKTHGDRYDYSKVVYITTKHKVEIGCEAHGSFWQRPNKHKSGAGCPTCANILIKLKNRDTLEQTVDGFKKIHGDRYDYSKVVYVNATTKVEIVCKEHGSFWQLPNSHKSGSGCPKCSNRKSERWFGECLEELGYKASKERPEWLRNPKTGFKLELDYYIPELKIAFEVQGLQHYKSIDYWGGEEAFEIRQERDQQKRNLCFMKGVTLYEYDLRLGRDKESMMAYLTKILKPKTQIRSFHDQILELIQKR